MRVSRIPQHHRSTTRLIALVLSGLALSGGVATAQDGSEPQVSAQAPVLPTQGRKPPGLTIHAGVDMLGTSRYVWRGFLPTDGFSLEPNLWVKIGGLTMSSWMNTTGPSRGGLFTEHDLTVDYTMSIGPFVLSTGWIAYFFPKADSGRHSNEIYAGVAHSSYLNPTLRVFQDVHAGAGTYVNISISHEYPVGKGVAIAPILSAGYNHRQWIADSTFSDAVIGLRIKLPTPSRHVTVAPFVNYSRSLAREFFPSTVSGGLGVSVQ